MESWVSLGGKEGCINIRILAKPGIELGTLWSEGRDLTNCTNHARPRVHAENDDNLNDDDYGDDDSNIFQKVLSIIHYSKPY